MHYFKMTLGNNDNAYVITLRDTFISRLGLIGLTTIIFTFLYVFWCSTLVRYVVPFLPDKEHISSNTGNLDIVSDSTKAKNEEPGKEETSEPKWTFGRICNFFKCASYEEVLFRLIPLFLVQICLIPFFFMDKRMGYRIIALAILISSIIFGYVHGNYINIMIQGIPGIYLSFIFLFNGGYILNKANRLTKAYLVSFGFICSTFAHGLINIFLTIWE